VIPQAKIRVRVIRVRVSADFWQPVTCDQQFLRFFLSHELPYVPDQFANN
jgi:hypothetical protein